MGGTDHGPWCDRSRGWSTPSDEFIVPVRIGEPFLDEMLTPNGWEKQIGAVMLRPHGDRTYDMFFTQADEPDHTANRAMQRMVAAGLDLAMALDESNDDLSEEVLEYLAAFKKAMRTRAGGGMPRE